MTLGFVLALTMQAAQPAIVPDLAPGARYDSRIPTLQQVAGHDFGLEITLPEQIGIYLKALVAAAPDRARLVEYARTWEGRPLQVLAIGSPGRMNALEQLKTDLGRLADPRALSAVDADRLVTQLPVVVWLMHAVHGNEISSSDAALAEGMERSALPVASSLQSGSMATASTVSVWPASLSRSVPVCASQIRAVLSLPPVTIHCLSRLQATALTARLWPRKTLGLRQFSGSSRPVCAVQMQTVFSGPGVSKLFPSGLNAKDTTGKFTGMIRLNNPDSASQMRAVWSKLPVATRRPSGEKATAQTTWSWPSRRTLDEIGATGQSFNVPSPEAVEIHRPSALKLMPITMARRDARPDSRRGQRDAERARPRLRPRRHAGRDGTRSRGALVSPRPGWAEQDPEIWWAAVCRACREVLAGEGGLRDRLAGAALTTQRGTVINVDRDGRALRPAIQWLDQRRATRHQPLRGLWGLAFGAIGLGETLAYLQAEAEANWIRTEQPEIWARTHKYLFLSGFLTHRLTGRFVDSVGCQVGYVPFDYRRLRWAGPRFDWKWRAAPIERACPCGPAP